MAKIEKCPVCGESGFLAKRWTKTPPRKYWHYYVGHYDKERYAMMMMSKNKRTNGRRWCYINDDKLTVLEKRKKEA